MHLTESITNQGTGSRLGRSMLKSQKLLLEQSEKRQKVNALLGKDSLTDEERGELDTLTTRLQQVEVEYRAALVIEQASELDTRDEGGIDAEHREALDLRRRCNLTTYFRSRLGGMALRGAELEYLAADGVPEGSIPLSVMDPDPRDRRAEQRADAPTPAPSTTGRIIAPIVPAVFEASIAAYLMVEMPRVTTGSYNVPRITTSLTAGWKGKGDVTDSTAAALTVETSTVKRLSGRMSLRMEDVAAVGLEDFEASLKMNLQQVVGNALDDALLNGTGASDQPTGLLARLTDPTAPGTKADFGEFVDVAAGAITASELWASGLPDVRTLAGPATMALSETVFRGTDSYVSAGAYLRGQTGGWRSNAHVPAPAATIQQAVQVLLGRPGLSIARMPTWGRLEVDDIYTGAAAATTYRTVHVLCGDLLVLHPDAFRQVAFKTA